MTGSTRPAPAIVTAALAAALAAAPDPAAAQVTVAADLGVASAYVARGLTSNNRLTLHPGVSLSAPVGPLVLSAGGWSAVEPLRYDGPGALSESGGTAPMNVGELDLWIEASRDLPIGRVTAGVMRYLFPNAAGVTADWNTSEVYARLATTLPLSPRIAVWWDVDEIDGAYVELGLSQPVGRVASRPVTLGLTAGFGAGQAVDAGDPDARGWFAADGLVFVGASASTSMAVGGLTLAPQAQLLYGHDALARVTGPGTTSRVKGVVGATLSWAREFR